MHRNARGRYKRGCKLPGECRGMAGERTVVGAKCQGNAGECRGMQGNAGECQGNVWECKLPGECRECRGMPGERMAVGV